MYNIKIIEEVGYIIDKLESGGHEAYTVGGCVRDSLLGKEPEDWDICTSAVPEQTIKLFENHHIIETGLSHGTVTLMLNHKPFEITTYRTDGVYTDNRRPDSVEFVTSLKEDLARRDFTVNAMAYNPKEGIADFFGGADDLKHKIIRCVGNADKRFKEDALRIMRALRFSSVLGFSIESETSAAIYTNKELLRNISSERISAELNKLITGRDAGSVMLEYAAVINGIIPELNTSESVDGVPADVVLRLAMMLKQSGADTAKAALARLKYDNRTITQVSELILYHNTEILPQRKHIKKLLNKIGEQRFRQLIEIKRAGAELSALLDEIIERRECYSLKDLSVSGRDLIAAGVPEGLKVGVILNRLLKMVIEETAENNKEVLLKIAENLMKE